MKPSLQLDSMLDTQGPERGLTVFALINLGFIESLANGLVGASDAVRLFYNADNCLYVKRHFKGKIANEIMGRGVQLQDLFDCLAAEDAQRQFQHELATMRKLCLTLIEKEELVA